MRLFGLEIKKAVDVAAENSELDDRPSDGSFKVLPAKTAIAPIGKKQLPSPVPEARDDGIVTIPSNAGYYGRSFVLGADMLGDSDQILKYREAAANPECDTAIAHIVDDSIPSADSSSPAKLNLDNLLVDDDFKNTISEEFAEVLKLFSYNKKAHEMFRSFYVDGRIHYHVVVDPQRLEEGIKELRWIDPILLRKIREVTEEIDYVSGAKIEKIVQEYYLYAQQFSNITQQANPGSMNRISQDTFSAVPIATDAIITATSGIYDPTRTSVQSHLHKAIVYVNQLKQMEVALVVYRLVRAPERRVFYIDTGNLPATKADAYVNSVVSKFRTKLSYNAVTGEVSDDRKSIAMVEDFYVPRKEGGRGTEIDTLAGGENLGQIEDIVYFQKKLYGSLNVPISRLENTASFNIGRSSEITREELKFQRFIDRLRKQFSYVILSALRLQLILKGHITPEDWKDMEETISIDFNSDNYFTELKEFEILRERMSLLDTVKPYSGVYFSERYIRTHILRQTFDEIKQLDDEMADELASGENAPPDPNALIDGPVAETEEPAADETEDMNADELEKAIADAEAARVTDEDETNDEDK